MSLPLETLQELVKLSGFHKKGALLERHFDALKKHVMAGNCIGKDNWEAMDLTLELRQGDVFPEDEWTKQIDGKVRDITNSAAASRSTQTDDALRATSAPLPPPPPPRQSKQPATTSAGGGVVSRGKLAMERAVKGTLGGNIMNAFPIGSGRPVSYSTA
ncbi:unnamed protein product [Ascophyllum nodosum]